MALILANGQLGASSATLYGPAGRDQSVQVTLFNTGETLAQEVWLRVATNGSTQTVFHGTLKGYHRRVLASIPLDASSVLSGYADGGSVVDYIVSATVAGPSVEYGFDEDGNPVSSQAITVSLDERVTPNAGEIEIINLLRDIRDIALQVK